MLPHLYGAEAPDLATPELAHLQCVDPATPGTAAVRSAVTPTSEKPSCAANVVGLVQTQAQCLVGEQSNDDGKKISTLRARMALKGYCRHRPAAGGGSVRFYVDRWDMTRELRDLSNVARFLDRVGGEHA